MSDSVFLDPIVSVIFNKSCKHKKKIIYYHIVEGLILLNFYSLQFKFQMS